MMKKLLLFTLLLSGFFTANAQYQKRVMVEEFTNASCPPCAAQNPGFNTILASRRNEVTPVKFQTNWPGVDPMNAQNPSETATRVSYYGVTGVPHGVLNGTPITNDCNGYDGAPACLAANEVDDLFAQTTPVKIVLTYHLSAGFDTIFVHADVTSDVDLSGTLQLRIAVVEETIYFAAAPGTNGETEFFQPMRKMLPNAAGTSTGAFAAGETKSYDLFWAIPAYIYDKNQLSVSAWLQDDDTKNVLQSARVLPPSAEVYISSDASFVCTPGANPSFTFTNTSENELTSAHFIYRFGNGAWTDYDWTGNLASGESATITLTDITITQNGTNTVDVRAVSSNNGSNQTTLPSGYSTVTIKGLFDPASALPFGNTFQSATFPPTGWQLKNLGTNGWKLATTAGSGSTRSAKNNMFDYDAAQTELVTPKVDLTQSTGTTTLNFDHAYAYYSAGYFDSLRVDISADCGTTWTTLFHDGYEGLATAPAVTTTFTPTASQWASHTIDISSFNGHEVLFRFVGESGYGNNAYIDNVNVSTAVGVKNLDLTSFMIKPNPTSDVAEVRFGLDKAQTVQLLVYNNLGALVQSQNLGQLVSGDHFINLDAARLNSGSYRVVLQGEAGIAQTQWIIVK